MNRIRKYNEFLKESNEYDNLSPYLNNDELLVDKVNEILNHPKFNKFINKIPDNLKRKITKFLNSDEVLDIDKMISFNKKYNIIEKVKKLWKNGITNINDIYNKISNSFPKNESATIIILVIFMIVALVIAAYGIIELFNSDPNSLLNSAFPSRISFIIPIILALLFAYAFYEGVRTETQKNKIVKELNDKNIDVHTLKVILNGEEKDFFILEYENGRKDTLTLKQFYNIDNEFLPEN